MKSLAFFRSISFGAFKSWNPAANKVVRPIIQLPEENESGELQSILLVTAQRAGTHTVFQLLVSHLTRQSISFRTSTELKVGEPLEVEILLQGVGNLTIMAQVRKVVLASMTRVTAPGLRQNNALNSPMFSGQLELWTTDGQQRDIQDFMRRHTCKARSSLLQ
jgi:hypothetical protein